MIDLKTEQLVTFDEATKFVPVIAGRRKPNRSTIDFWARIGIMDVRLETVCVGGVAATSREAVERFIEKTTALRFSPDRPTLRRQKSGGQSKAPRGRDRKAAAGRKRQTA